MQDCEVGNSLQVDTSSHFTYLATADLQYLIERGRGDRRADGVRERERDDPCHNPIDTLFHRFGLDKRLVFEIGVAGPELGIEYL